MKRSYNVRRTIPDVLNAIRDAEDVDEVSYYENIMVGMYASLLLLLAAIANYIVSYAVQSQPLGTVLINSFSYLFLSVAFDAATRINLEINKTTLIISALSFITLLFTTIKFYDTIGSMIWTVAFILILLSMIRITKIMLYTVSAAILVSGAYIAVHSFRMTQYQINMEFSITQMVLVPAACVIAVAVHRIYTDRYLNAQKHLADAIREKEKTEALNEEITAGQREINYLAFHDNLTGLPNRMLFSDQISHAISSSKHTGKSFAIMYLDLDDFKMINDTMGHALGDQLLVELSKRLVGALKKNDIASRIGGDEFNILIENLDDAGDVKIMANKILKCFDKPFMLNDRECLITTSIGVVIYPADGDNADVLIKNADVAMYKAKEKGKNQYVLCDAAIKSAAEETLKLSGGLYRALERNELELYYQPRVSCNSDQIVGVEALIRWNHPELGMIYPKKFIPIAEQNGLIIPIGEWVLRTACGQNKAWQAAGYPRIRVSVNISVVQLRNPNIVGKLEEVLQVTGLDPEYLELEITESIAMKEKEGIIGILNAIKKSGVHISIDDFGTEYSSLNYLKQLPADRIKIDMSFVQGIDTGNNDEAIIRAIIVLAKSMGINVVAEGVEAKNQYDFLIREYCDEIQGFYCFRPMSAAEAEKVLKQLPGAVNKGI